MIQRATPLTGAQEDALTRLPDFVDEAGRTYTPGDRRRQVRRWLARVGSLQMTSAGRVQFIPEDGAGLVTALTRAPEALRVHVWAMPLARATDVAETLTQSLDAEITQKTAALLTSVQTAREAEKTPTIAQQTKLVDQPAGSRYSCPTLRGAF